MNSETYLVLSCKSISVRIWIFFSTPLHFAAGHGHLDIVKKLIEYNADVKMKTHSGKNAYVIAVMYGWMEVADYLENLLWVFLYSHDCTIFQYYSA